MTEQENEEFQAWHLAIYGMTEQAMDDAIDRATDQASEEYDMQIMRKQYGF